MKLAAIVGALAIVAGLIWMLGSDDPEPVAVTGPEPVAEVEEAPEEKVELVSVWDEPEPEPEPEPESDPKGPYADLDLSKPHMLNRKRFPDGTVQVDWLAPIYIDGKKKTIIRRFTARPRIISRDRIQKRPAPTAAQEAGRERLREFYYGSDDETQDG